MTDKVDPAMAMFTGYTTYKNIPKGDNRRMSNDEVMGSDMFEIEEGDIWCDPTNDSVLITVIGVLPPFGTVIVNRYDILLQDDREEAYDLSSFGILFVPAKIVPREG